MIVIRAAATRLFRTTNGLIFILDSNVFELQLIQPVAPPILFCSLLFSL
jgi:hypothetical protein